MKQLFGTDGMRGTVNQHPMTVEMIAKLGLATGVFLKIKGHHNKVVIAKDTRLSGYLVEPALTSAFISLGIDVILVGPMPTPSVPMLIKSLRADFGVMVSASHNPYCDNGVKLFDSRGFKLSSDVEEKIQSLIAKNHFEKHLAKPEGLGRAKRLDDAPGRYIEFVKSTFPKSLSLNGMRIVIDSANGSAYKLTPTIFWELGAEVISIGSSPNGFNINEKVGSTNPEAMAKKVVETKADIGIALDGDADRVVIADEKGRIIHGDSLIGMIASYMQKRAALKGNGVVLTHVSNRGLEHHLKSLGVDVIRTDIGDKNVFSMMQKHGINLGGEQSGHIIFSDYTTTGDGTIAALQVLAQLAASAQPLSQLSKEFELYPQVSENIKFKEKNPLEVKAVSKGLDKIKIENPDAKIIVRKSGTEKLVRVLVEGDKRKTDISKISNQIQGLILGGI